MVHFKYVTTPKAGEGEGSHFRMNKIRMLALMETIAILNQKPGGTSLHCRTCGISPH